MDCHKFLNMIINIISRNNNVIFNNLPPQQNIREMMSFIFAKSKHLAVNIPNKKGKRRVRNEFAHLYV